MKRWLILLTLTGLLASACTVAGRPAPPGPGSAEPGGPATRTGATPGAVPPAAAEPDLNPHVRLPDGPVKIAPNLPQHETPPGWLSQDEIIRRALETVAGDGKEHGYLTLSSVSIENGMWVVDFDTDGRRACAPRSHPAPMYSTDDPAERRRQEKSWASICQTVSTAFEGVTGEVRGGGFRGGLLNPSRPDLEHYRGYILTGGADLKLRLVNPGGAREGRDMDVTVPQQALDASGLSLWQLQYGTGRILDVWGLSGSPGSVAAYRLAMDDPPPESLLQAGLIEGLPQYPGAYISPGRQPGHLDLKVKDADPEAVDRWYAEHLPAYGWTLSNVAEGPGWLGRYRSAAWESLLVGVGPQDGGVLISFIRE